MSSYIARLATQTGVKIGPTPNAPPTRPANLHAGSASDSLEQHVESESPSPAAESANVSNPMEAPTRPAGRLSQGVRIHNPVSAEGQPKTAIAPAPDEPGREPAEIHATGEPSLGHVSDVAQVPGGAPRSTLSTPGSAITGEFSATKIVQEVMAWIATDNAVPVSNEATSATDAASPSATAKFIATVSTNARSADVSPRLSSARAEHPLNAPQRQSPNSEPASTSVHIGAIHLSIEAPPEKSAPLRMETPRAIPPPAPPRPVGSRLRLHYLRPC